MWIAWYEAEILVLFFSPTHGAEKNFYDFVLPSTDCVHILDGNLSDKQSSSIKREPFFYIVWLYIR